MSDAPQNQGPDETEDIQAYIDSLMGVMQDQSADDPLRSFAQPPKSAPAAPAPPPAAPAPPSPPPAPPAPPVPPAAHPEAVLPTSDSQSWESLIQKEVDNVQTSIIQAEQQGTTPPLPPSGMANPFAPAAQTPPATIQFEPEPEASIAQTAPSVAPADRDMPTLQFDPEDGPLPVPMPSNSERFRAPRPAPAEDLPEPATVSSALDPITEEDEEDDPAAPAAGASDRLTRWLKKKGGKGEDKSATAGTDKKSKSSRRTTFTRKESASSDKPAAKKSSRFSKKSGRSDSGNFLDRLKKKKKKDDDDAGGAGASGGTGGSEPSPKNTDIQMSAAFEPEPMSDRLEGSALEHVSVAPAEPTLAGFGMPSAPSSVDIPGTDSEPASFAQDEWVPQSPLTASISVDAVNAAAKDMAGGLEARAEESLFSEDEWETIRTQHNRAESDVDLAALSEPVRLRPVPSPLDDMEALLRFEPHDDLGEAFGAPAAASLENALLSGILDDVDEEGVPANASAEELVRSRIQKARSSVHLKAVGTTLEEQLATASSIRLPSARMFQGAGSWFERVGLPPANILFVVLFGMIAAAATGSPLWLAAALVGSTLLSVSGMDWRGLAAVQGVIMLVSGTLLLLTRQLTG